MNYFLQERSVYRTPLKAIKTKFTENEVVAFFNSCDIAREGLYLASPLLYSKLEDIITGKLRPNEKEYKKVLVSLLKYALRIHNRTTPFGFFSQVGVVKNLHETTSVFIEKSKIGKVCELDYNVIFKLFQKALSFSEIKNKTTYYLNNTAYKVNDNLRFIEANFSEKEKKFLYQISSVDINEYLNAILPVVENGCSIDELKTILRKLDNSLEDENINDFIEELIFSQVIYAEISPLITESPLSFLINKLKNYRLTLSECKSFENDLHSIRDILCSINQSNQFEKKHYDQLIYILNTHGIEIKNSVLANSYIIHANTNKTDKVVDIKSIHDIVKGLASLQNLQKTRLDEFKEKFLQRYQEEEVELNVVLDNDIGLGYAVNHSETGVENYLLKDLVLTNSKSNMQGINLSPSEIFLMKKIANAKANDLGVLKLTIEDIASFGGAKKTQFPNFISSFSIMYSFVMDKKIHLKCISGPSATNLISRFSKDSDEIFNICQEINDKETDQDSNEYIIASIIHCPQPTIGNVIARSQYRNYEIPYLTHSLKNRDNLILTSDLYLSVKNNKLVLQSKKLNKIVIPRLDSAHNFSSSDLSMYQFLCDLQYQDCDNEFSFSWGHLGGIFNILPRVEMNEIIIYPASWFFSVSEIESLLQKLKKDKITNVFKEFKDRFKLPDIFLIVDGDNELVIDSSNSLSLELFFMEIKNKPSLLLQEFLYDETNGFFQDSDNGSYANEVVSFFVSNNQQNNNSILTAKTDVNIQRKFSIGSEWLFLKIYCSVTASDKVLYTLFNNTIQNLLRQNKIQKWFFIRYSDPDFHIRLRIYSKEYCAFQILEIIQADLQELLNRLTISNYLADTYNRELERYGMDNIEFAETVFFQDSELYLSFLEKYRFHEEIENKRILIALKSIDILFDISNLTLDDKISLISDLKAKFYSEFNISGVQKKQLNKTYDGLKKEILSVLFSSIDDDRDFQYMINQYCINLQKEAKEFNKLPLVTKFSILSSLTHMIINRIFKSKQRANEMVIYDFLSKAYNYYKNTK